MPGPLDVEGEVRDRLARGDDAGAATAAIRSVGPQVLGFLRYLVRNDADASDAFSEFSERLWRGLGEYRGEGSLRAFAFRIAARCAYDVRDDAWHRRGRRLATREVSALVEEVRSRTFERVERERTALDALREALPLADQALLVLRVDQKLSWAEVAQALSTEREPLTEDAALKRFERLTRRLQKAARDRGLLGP